MAQPHEPRPDRTPRNLASDEDHPLESRGPAMTGPARNRYITCVIKANGPCLGRTEILDTTIDGGENEPLIVGMFYDGADARKFAHAANRVQSLADALQRMVETHPACTKMIGDPGSPARTLQANQEAAIAAATAALASWRGGPR